MSKHAQLACPCYATVTGPLLAVGARVRACEAWFRSAALVACCRSPDPYGRPYADSYPAACRVRPRACAGVSIVSPRGVVFSPLVAAVMVVMVVRRVVRVASLLLLPSLRAELRELH